MFRGLNEGGHFGVVAGEFVSSLVGNMAKTVVATFVIRSSVQCRQTPLRNANVTKTWVAGTITTSTQVSGAVPITHKKDALHTPSRSRTDDIGFVTTNLDMLFLPLSKTYIVLHCASMSFLDLSMGTDPHQI